MVILSPKIEEKNISIWRFFQISTHKNVIQTNSINVKFFMQALCWECYSKLKNEVGIYFIKDPDFDPKIWKKKTPENCHNHNIYPIRIFLHKLYAGNTTANQRIKYHTLQIS